MPYEAWGGGRLSTRVWRWVCPVNANRISDECLQMSIYEGEAVVVGWHVHLLDNGVVAVIIIIIIITTTIHRVPSSSSLLLYHLSIHLSIHPSWFGWGGREAGRQWGRKERTGSFCLNKAGGTCLASKLYVQLASCASSWMKPVTCPALPPSLPHSLPQFKSGLRSFNRRTGLVTRRIIALICYTSVDCK